MPQHTLSDYVQLIDSFVHGEISALEFERVYLQMYKEDPTIRPEAEYDILDRLFFGVDAFCADSASRSIHDIDEEQLRAEARTALGHLRAAQPCRASHRRAHGHLFSRGSALRGPTHRDRTEAPTQGSDPAPEKKAAETPPQSGMIEPDFFF
jgi:hypothetical protein